MAERICSVDGCTKPHRAKGLCSTHYCDARYGPDRRHSYATARPCECCTKSFYPKRKGQRYCSLPCRSGGTVKGTYTEERSRYLRDARRIRRATLATVERERFTEQEIYERDRWRCGICRKTVSRTLTWPHPKSASLDHVVPLSEGGGHTRANVRLSHLRCNISRNNRGGGEQLALLG